MSLSKLKTAIANRCPVEFEYNKLGKSAGKRIGNPHAIYILKLKDGTESTKVDIVQTGGVTDSGREFPSFRRFDIEELTNVALLTELPKFSPASEYKPESELYKFVIAKI